MVNLVANTGTRPRPGGSMPARRPRIAVRIGMIAISAALCIWAAGADGGGEADLGAVERARRLHDLRAGTAGPLTLLARGTLFRMVGGDRPLSFVLMAYGPGHWFERTTSGSYSELRGLVAGTSWRRRAAASRSYRLAEVEMLLDPTSHLKLVPGATVRKRWPEAVAGVTAECLEVGPLDRYWQHDMAETVKLPEIGHDADRTVRLCFDRGSGGLLRADYGAQFARFEYAGEVALADQRFPRTLRCFEQQELVVEAEVSSLTPAEAPEAGSAKVPEGAESWPACERPTPPRMIAKKPVMHPAHAKARREFGQVICLAELSTVGELQDVVYLEDRGYGFLRAAVGLSLPEWRYEPATCDGKPVPFELRLAIQFPAR